MELGRGAWELSLEAAGCAPVALPVLPERGAHEDFRRPGSPTSAPIPLPRADTLGPEEIYVPAGWFWTGDPAARYGLPRRRVWVDGFVIGRFPVTNADYLAFLNALVDAGDEQAALAHVPRASAGAGQAQADPFYGREADGHFVLVADEQGDVWSPQWPVVSITWHDARAYAAWIAAQTGQPWRLPSEWERVKAARGTDGRLFPWGDHPEPTWSRNRTGRRERATPADVDTHPVDTSPYGVRGCAGNVRDWCLDARQATGPTMNAAGLHLPPTVAPDPASWRATRGGAWGGGVEFGRAGARFYAPEAYRGPLVGMRLARSFPGA